MPSLFTVLSSFSESLALEGKVSDETKFMFLNNVLFMVRPTPINLNPLEL